MDRRILTLALALTVAMPLASATWFGPGSYEPDTTFDEESTYMWSSADTDANLNVHKVYFNAFPTQYVTATNQNVGTTGSRITSTPTMYWQAHFGVWKDCNLDGYIGLAESAIQAYRAELLPSGSPCGAEPGKATAHNDGTWVYEFLHLGPLGTPDYEHHPSILPDADAAVWGDLGEPGFAPGQSCPIIPPPHGTTSGTGATIRWVDCIANARITGAVNTVDPDGSLGIGFSDPNNPQHSDSLLNHELPESLFGNPRTDETGALQKDPENDGETAFTTWDCNERAAEVKDDSGTLPRAISDPTSEEDDNLTTIADDDGVYFWTATPAPSANDPTHSFAAGLNETANGFNAFDDTAGGSCTGASSDTDDGNTYETVHETAFFYADGAVDSSAQGRNKFQSSMDFAFYDGDRAFNSATALPNGTRSNLTSVVGERFPNTLGLQQGQSLLDPNWGADTVYVSQPQSINRNTLQPSGPAYYTFYARAGSSASVTYALQFPGTAGFYGEDNCSDPGASGSPDEKGWECDSATWYIDANGVDLDPTNVQQRVGVAFHVRDVDCLDGSLARGVPVFASLVAASDQPGGCADAS